MSLGLDHPIEIATPFLEWEKADVIRRGVELGVPFELTLSCMNPVMHRRTAAALRTVQQVPRAA